MTSSVACLRMEWFGLRSKAYLTWCTFLVGGAFTCRLFISLPRVRSAWTERQIVFRVGTARFRWWLTRRRNSRWTAVTDSLFFKKLSLANTRTPITSTEKKKKIMLRHHGRNVTCRTYVSPTRAVMFPSCLVRISMRWVFIRKQHICMYLHATCAVSGDSVGVENEFALSISNPWGSCCIAKCANPTLLSLAGG